jgi:CheY-like chemotaxis protein
MPLQLLYIEDDQANHRFLQEFSEREGYELHSAYDGTTGIKMAQELLPDVIITDINLPDIYGDEVCTQLKASPTTSHIPIIAFTGHSNMHGDQDRLLAIGFDDYVTKPFNRVMLKMAIERTSKGG